MLRVPCMEPAHVCCASCGEPCLVRNGHPFPPSLRSFLPCKILAVLLCAWHYRWPLWQARVPRNAPTNHIDMPYPHDTGYVQNTGLRADVIDSFTVDVPGADWLRLYFSKADLPRGTELRITSWADGDVQILTGQNMAQWQNTSCYLNGDKLQSISFPKRGPSVLELSCLRWTRVCPSRTCPSAAPRTTGSLLRILVLREFCPLDAPAACLTIVPGCFMTAGHCDGALGVAQFNVPPSTAGGSLVNPPASDQYPVDPASVQSNGGLGVGNDWAVFGCFDNPSTGLQASAAQGPGYTLGIDSRHRWFRRFASPVMEPIPVVPTRLSRPTWVPSSTTLVLSWAM